MRDREHQCGGGQRGGGRMERIRQVLQFAYGHHSDVEGGGRGPFGGRGRGRGWGRGGPGGFGGGFGPSGGGPGRMLETGDLRFLILHLMQTAPRHGYEIIKSIEEMLGGTYAPSPGIVYPTLTMLEEMGEAAVAVEGTRKFYSITPDGTKALEANRAAVDAILERMKQVREKSSTERPGQIIRAIENLRLVLQMKAGKLSKEQLEAVTDILDNAAKQIERL